MSEPEKGLHLVKEDDAPKVLPYRSLRAREEQTEYLGMVIFICGWGVLFLGLFMAYAVIRSSAPSWPPPGTPHLPRALAALDTAVLLAANFSLQLGVRAMRTGKRPLAVQAMVVALALGGMFLALQAALWSSLVAAGFTLDSGTFAELFYVLTGFQSLQLGVGELALFYVLARTWRGLVNAARLGPLRLWALYWTASCGVWLVTFVAVFLV